MKLSFAQQGFTIPVALLLMATIPSSEAGPPTLTITLNGSGAQLTVSSDTGVTNQIQTATDLSQPSWSILTNFVVTTSPYLFSDARTPGSAQRFYRVVALSRIASSNVPPTMVLIPAGTFEMGDFFNEGANYEVPVHQVYVSAFYLEKYEVSKALWDQVVLWSTTNGYAYDYPGAGKGPNHPVQSIDWYDMVKWCNARSQMEGLTPAYYTDSQLAQVYKTGKLAPFVNWTTGYRLPTEAEWEKAARGGATGHRFPWSDVDTITHNQANYFSDSSFSYDVSPTRGFNPAFNDGVTPYTSPVGSFAPNGYGLYDTAGNVWEWCWDWAGNYPTEPQTDPRGPDTGTTRVGRGGNWDFYAEHCRVAYRYGNSPDYLAANIGFRCALPAH